ncbi:hypothetical protein T06_12202 [Trichinella sp. T6]|nr:hypothetical protein T06_11409 [Trichinella sp. T6]KRX33940.1 hypothetical protein T06_12202 [Trichinella sp. T6]
MNPILVANVVENNAHTERTRKQLRTGTSDVETTVIMFLRVLL